MVPRTQPPKALPARQTRIVTRALADPRRYQILKRIATNACSPCSELRASFPITPATLSHHLKELEAAGLVTTTRRGKFVDVHFCRDTWQRYLATLAKL